MKNAWIWDQHSEHNDTECTHRLDNLNSDVEGDWDNVLEDDQTGADVSSYPATQTTTATHKKMMIEST